MSEIKRSKNIERNKQFATSALDLMKTLRRLELARYPSGIYYDPSEVFSVWAFAKKYGDRVDDRENKQ